MKGAENSVMTKLLLIGGAAIAAVVVVITLIIAGVGVVAVTGATSGAGGIVMVASGKGAASGSCTVTIPAGSSAGAPLAEGAYTPEQVGIIQQIVGIGKAANVPEKGWVVALIVAMQESGIRNLDHGTSDSVGVMQQRPSMQWGSVEQLMNPAYAIQAFYLGVNGNGNPGLMSITGWDQMTPTKAAQTVQRSLYPTAYEAHYTEASLLIDKYKDAPLVPLLKVSPVNSSAGNANVGPSGTSTCGVGGTPGSVQATGDDYPGRTWEPDVGSVAGGKARECVDFAAWRMRQHSPGFDPKKPLSGTRFALGNGADWGPAAAAAGFAVDRHAKAGDIAYWGATPDDGYGHVAFVAAVNADGTISLEEYNWIIPLTGGATDHNYHTRTISSADPTGYIHFIGNPKLATMGLS